jgi:flagellar FliJ protein
MKPSLALLLEIARRRCEEAARALAAASAAHAESERQGELLERYRAEYADRLAAAARCGIGGESLRQQHRFLDRLDAAREEQRREAERARARLAQARALWRSAERRREAYAALERRRAAAAALGARRAEQCTQDEIAAAGARSRAPQRNET